MIPTVCPECHKPYQAASRTYAEDPERKCGACITIWAEKKDCPDCGSGPIKTKMKESWFQYRSGPGKTFLKCVEPLRICQACDFVYLDYASEEIHMMAVNRYLVATGHPPQEK